MRLLEDSLFHQYLKETEKKYWKELYILTHEIKRMHSIPKIYTETHHAFIFIMNLKLWYDFKVWIHLLSDTWTFTFHFFFFFLIIYDCKNYRDCLFREESLKNAFLTTTWNVTAFNSLLWFASNVIGNYL